LISLRIADAGDREEIYAIRHRVYASELGQHAENAKGRITDALDDVNIYLVATIAGEIAGFVSITPPSSAGYSIDKYFARSELPLSFDDGLYEVRLLTVTAARRCGRVAALLMYGAWRYIQSRGGRTIVCIGRLALLEMYERVGLRSLDRRARSGKVTYELMTLEVGDTLAECDHIAADLESHVDWRVSGVSFRPGGTCYHGGAFFEAIGDELDDLERRADVINADVLDAWFDPAPDVMAALAEHFAWALRTSPPVGSDGMRRVVARTRGVSEASILPGAGSSDLIFLALRHWLHAGSRVLILDPMYGEYAHVLERVVGCRVARLELARSRDYAVNIAELSERLERRYDLVVLVNPNSPTGQHLPARVLEDVLRAAPDSTRFWVDETYVEYVGEGQSLERFAAASSNVVICKSMSKVYALSGARCGYLCGPRHLIEELRTISPPWAVSLPGQIAACAALRSTEYYRERWSETHRLREELASGLRSLGWDVLPGCANFLLCHLPHDQPTAAALAAVCKERKLFVRDVTSMGRCFGERALRIAVKDSVTNTAMLDILRRALMEFAGSSRVDPAA
jgi:histidinol-phosphate/aromatic aminotransferase/cobyric acid decarboxylase-like protein/N-acyl-L-homoserine lactone synthetase